MRTTVIPAQITTVEDKIAGNLNLTQIVLLLLALLSAVFMYAVLPPKATFQVYKIPFIVLSMLTFAILSLRVKNRVIINWIVLLASYYFRPAFYIANKNDLYLRDVILDIPVKIKSRKATSLKEAKKVAEVPIFNPVSVERVLGISRAKLSFKFEKGGLNAIWQVKK